MRAFLVELTHFLGTLWGRSWRWVIRKRRNVAILFGGVLFALIVLSIVVQSSPTGTPIAKPTPTPTPTDTIAYSDVTATPLPTAKATPTARPTASPGASTSADKSKGIPAPKEPKVDRSNPESVARGWATAYLSRPSAEWLDWAQWIDDYTMPAVVKQLQLQAFQPEQILDGKAPTAVTKVEVAPPGADADTNTPVRWSHNLVVTVLSGDGSSTKITFAVVLSDSDAGWTVTQVEEVSVQEG